MKLLFGTCLLIFSLDFISNTCLSKYDFSSPTRMFVAQSKRFATECILLDGGIKGSKKDVVEGILGIESLLLKCSTQLTNTIVYSSSYWEDLTDEIKKREKLISIVCESVNELTTCLNPLQDLFKKCKKTDGIALIEVVKHACKQNGKNIIELLDAHVESCIDRNEKVQQKFQECLDRNINSKTNDTLAYLERNFCRVVTDAKSCFQEVLDSCTNTKAKNIIQTFLTDLKNDSEEAKKCYFNENLPRTQMQEKKLLQTEGKKRKHSRPKYVW